MRSRNLLTGLVLSITAGFMLNPRKQHEPIDNGPVASYEQIEEKKDQYRNGIKEFLSEMLTYLETIPSEPILHQKEIEGEILESSLISRWTEEEEDSDLWCFESKLIQKIRSTKDKTAEEAMKYINTPLEAAIYCTKNLTHAGKFADLEIYGYYDYWASFSEIHELKRDDCDGCATAAAALLSDDGYEPYILVMRGPQACHAVFLYQNQHGQYGTIGCHDNDITKPEHTRLPELVERFYEITGNLYTDYRVFNLDIVSPGYKNQHENHSPHVKIQQQKYQTVINKFEIMNFR